MAATIAADRHLAAARRLFEHLAGVVGAPIAVKLWDGSRVPLGPGDSPFAIALSSPGVIGSLLRRPTLENLVRHYACGNIDVEGGDLIDFVRTARRAPGVKKRVRSLRKWHLLKQVWPFLFARSPKPTPRHAYPGDAEGRRAADRTDEDYIRFHYDISNDFYRLFLDAEMQYSCGYFTHWNNSLDQAQRDKMEMICRKLRLRPGESLLDVGCGWGGLVCYAARRYGVRAHGVTLSQEQLDFARDKIRRLGLQDRVTVELRDYRTLEGQYDKIASIGMFEHVGIANLPDYFDKLYSLLRDRGVLLNHGITLPAKKDRRKFGKIRPEARIILKYIFPGGELDHVGHCVELMEGARFEVHDAENWRAHYAETCAHWCRRLTARRDEAVAIVGPERYRLWVGYLAGCSYGFRDGSVRIFQVVASKHQAKGVSELPPTRADLYAA